MDYDCLDLQVKGTLIPSNSIASVLLVKMNDDCYLSDAVGWVFGRYI